MHFLVLQIYDEDDDFDDDDFEQSMSGFNTKVLPIKTNVILILHHFKCFYTTCNIFFFKSFF